MALFEYKCLDCGKVSEFLVFSSSDELSCPLCGSKNLDKLLSTFAVRGTPSPSSVPPLSCPSGGACQSCSFGG
jgi:putative FmdB family regulatory protein